MNTAAETIVCEIDGVCDSRRTVPAMVVADQGKALVRHPVICRFRTGTKSHASLPIAWLRGDGIYHVGTQIIHNRHVRVIGWKDSPTDTNSGWTS